MINYFLGEEIMIVTSGTENTARQCRGRGRIRNRGGSRSRGRGRGRSQPLLRLYDTYNSLKEIPLETEITAPDGTNWKVETTNCALPGRRGQQNLFRDHAGPISYAKRHVDETCSSSWRLMIDKKILKQVLSCTIAEA